MQDIYISDQYAELNPSWHEEDSPWKAGRVADILSRNRIDFRSFLEVGCGTGEILLNLHKHYPDVDFTGYEISPHAFQRAKLKENASVCFNFGDVLQEKDIHSDVVLLADVIEHVDDYLGFIKGVKPLGRYKIFHIPLDLSAQSVLRGWPITNLRKQVGHLHYFFKDTALATLVDCGYSIIDYQYTASRLELPNQALSSQIMRWPRKILFRLFPDLTVRSLGGYSLLVLAE
ncbi:class I SAM-dependent methyltransferase [Allorhizobium sp. BGMRC 0089]|uniref:class I SAM-dependent methyltransferase n=1 Tax=Allorhizobium sonneratiae TaxID=2934936 RepID=UPI0020346D74|nr:class I SAM-dependent methyltransferase [Allorhizobium sonneratiae]